MTFTKERLTELSRRENVGAILGEEIAELARIALASLEAEVVGYVDAEYAELLKSGHIESCSVYAEPGEGGITVFSAPPAPVSVPDEATPENIEILASTYAPCGVTYQWDRDECNAAADSWNACRAAMLQGAENAESPSGNSPVIPDGWVACSDKNPENGRWLALFGKRTKENCDPYVDEGYLGSDGEFYFFDWESGPRIDDCHPYDKAIVSHWMYWELPAAPRG